MDADKNHPISIRLSHKRSQRAQRRVEEEFDCFAIFVIFRGKKFDDRVIKDEVMLFLVVSVGHCKNVYD
jgi:hypothetical protein